MHSNNKPKREKAKPTRSKNRSTKSANKQEVSVKTLKVTNVKGKAGLHSNNLHQGRYDFKKLIHALPELAAHVIKNPKGESSINFSDPIAVKLLNKALLSAYYQVTEWDIPPGYLCPPIPGRADYIHRLAELLSKEHKHLEHRQVRALDIGVGANCIYPIVGTTQYGWNYIGADVDPESVDNANQIAQQNSVLKGRVECRLQPQSRHFFKGIIQANEFYHLTTCNPPFHKSLAEAELGTARKIKNLSSNKNKRGQAQSAMPTKTSTILNFGGQKAELWCPGGEAAFIKNMAFESKEFSAQVLWFSTLISKKENVRWMRKNLEKAGAVEAKVVEMSQGQKISRFVAWTFLTAEQRELWLKHNG
ncbi:23S rRNA mA1618 methyltransferase [Vibrio sinaloensis DSM 21326]|uniref:Ribosomal RNA large subunit methyltransferase F n=1 Tax=Vibrio sinaloensis DSM 21326 TaxID=945550 RepID=E8M609_PHOS4|nr:23S rRNA (adenine(1618)-N(6))-methyltransferase RlmF [Vibrio sinaloensis]EGA70459.1 23S rRNA mA1618 methyltransferase [Vibrio sinaloensis DSM 21326]